jgi:hypothetical protein
MSLTVSVDLIDATKTAQLKTYRDSAGHTASHIRADQEFVIDTSKLDADGLGDIIDAANSINDKKTARAVESILLARSGVFDKPVPNFKAFQGMLEAFLKKNCIDGWIYVAGYDGKLYPRLVTSVAYEDGRNYSRHGMPCVRIYTIGYGFYLSDYKARFGTHNESYSFSPQSVANRRMADILAAAGIYKETQALRDAHMASLERHYGVTQNAFSDQFRVNGAVFYFEDDNYKRRGAELSGRRVIHDLEAKDCGPMQGHAESFVFDNTDADGVGQVPEHPVIRVFDLRTHEFLWVHADNLTPYEYDKSLRDKLILPHAHRDLLDVLTTDLGAFVNDFIEDKSAGNVILCKGIPGVGKTLTAEVYAELIERPLYAIRSGSLGTTATDIEKNLGIVFQRGKRWNCVLLLDEADVFVVQRGNNIQQNAIVAEFLRTLEYFDGLLFMTTNRPDDIDEAIVSRCAAIIDYAPPSAKDARAIWRVMATQYEADLSDDLVGQLIDLFPEITPRDIKMLFRLALRMAAAHKEPLTADIFRRCAMFRAIKIAEDFVRF